jgi:pimeloyl-ACP methyl ester carboxylesterase
MRAARNLFVLAFSFVPLGAGAAGRKVEVRAPDGVALAATVWSAERPGPGIVLFHMCNSDRSAWSGLGEKLAARGFHVLALDYRGYGESGGVREKDGAAQQRIVDEKWPGDADAAFDLLLSQPGVDRPRVGAAGGSCGVNQAVQLARRHPEVGTLVLLAGNASREGREFLAGNPWLPVFASAARDDGGAVEAMKWLIGYSSHPANRMVEYEKGGHGTEMFAVHADLEPAIVDWFEEHLVRHPASKPAAASTPAKGGPSAELEARLREPGAAAKLRVELRAARARKETIALPPEGIVNLLGYEKLQGKDAAGAIELFLLNVEAHPESANAHDSLSDGYLEAGDRERAGEHAEKAIAALAGDPNQSPEFQKAIRAAAEDKLRQLAAPPKPD